MSEPTLATPLSELISELLEYGEAGGFAVETFENPKGTEAVVMLCARVPIGRAEIYRRALIECGHTCGEHYGLGVKELK